MVRTLHLSVAFYSLLWASSPHTVSNLQQLNGFSSQSRNSVKPKNRDIIHAFNVMQCFQFFSNL